MALKLRFRNISGIFFQGSFKAGAKVQDAIDFLSKRLKTKSNLIFLISPKPDQAFYKNNESIKNIIKNKQDYITFVNFSQQGSNTEKITHNNKRLQQTKMIIPSNSAISAFNNFSDIQNISRKERAIYMDYAFIVQNVPDDIQDRVNQLAQLGYDAEDCREALRDADYEVNQAVEILIRRHNNNFSEEQYNNDMLSLISALYMHLFVPGHSFEEEEEEWEEEDNRDSDSRSGSDLDYEYVIESESDSDDRNEYKNIARNDNEHGTSTLSISAPVSPQISSPTTRPITPPISPPISPPRLPASTSPRVSINKNLSAHSNTASFSRSQEVTSSRLTDESDDQQPRAKQTIIISRPNRITKPNVQPSQHRPISPKPNSQKIDNNNLSRNPENN